MTNLPEPTVTPTRYLVTCVSEDEDPGGYRGITVEYRGDDRYAVLRLGWCLGIDGEWDYEMRTSERTDEWLAAHRFDLDTALRLATEQAPLVTGGRDG
ncbi:hypothetical protein [Streptomyces rochei]|uniref:hypothetical protein n=1 Tax=Streptomyces rochei TaxID=1928 RepID=UPI0036930F6F